MKRDDEFVAMYEVFQQSDKRWYFVIPEEHGPVPDCGDILCGPYATATQAAKDVADILFSVVMRGLEL